MLLRTVNSCKNSPNLSIMCSLNNPFVQCELIINVMLVINYFLSLSMNSFIIFFICFQCSISKCLKSIIKNMCISVRKCTHRVEGQLAAAVIRAIVLLSKSPAAPSGIWPCRPCVLTNTLLQHQMFLHISPIDRQTGRL